MQYLYWLVGNDWTMVDIDGDGVGDTPGDRYGLLRGDLGESIKQKKPVMALIGQRVPATLRLGVAALALGYMIGVVLGVLAAVFHRTWVDQIIRIISVVGNAVPAFWLGLLLIILFGVKLRVLPISGSGRHHAARRIRPGRRALAFDSAGVRAVIEHHRLHLALHADADAGSLAAGLHPYGVMPRGCATK